MTLAPDTLAENDLPVDFGRYTLTGILGAGGMGRVFSAVLTGPSGFRKDVALKVIRPARPGDPPVELDEEARIGGLLKHPNVIDVYDFGEVDGHPFICMEFVRGLDLAALGRRVRLAPAHVVQIGAAIAAGLQHAHELTIDGRAAGLVHRDLKPSNIIVSRDGITKVMDFGIAKLRGAPAGNQTETGTAVGTPAYMSPEQAAAEELDGRSDLFALGAILYELATGEQLLQGSTVIELTLKLLQLPERLAAPGALDAVDATVPGLAPIVARLLAASPADRPATAADVEAALWALDVPPAPSLRALVRDLLAGGDGQGLLASEAATRAHPRAAATLRVAPQSNLPRSSTSFLGREDELTRLGEVATPGRLVSLVGPGGTGKTRLALEFARRVLARSATASAWFVPCQDAVTTEGFLHAVGGALNIPWNRGDVDEHIDRLGHALAGRDEVVVVFDNLEQVLDAAAPALARWCELATEARLLVTTRERLRLDGESVFAVGPLSDDAARRLFLARAATARGAELPRDEHGAIDEIVAALDRLPLAVELAAARASMLPPSKIASRLDQRFRLLRGRDRNVGRRQATLEGAIAWSWDLLDEAERWTLAWCSVCRGGFQLSEAEEMIDLEHFDAMPWVMDVIEALRDKSLLRELPTRGDSARFGMYESIRAFASQRLDELGCRTDAEAAHARVYQSRARALLAGLRSAAAVQVMREVALEEENFQAVLERDPSPDTLVEISLTMGRHLFRNGPRRALDDLMKASWAVRHDLPDRLRAELLGAYSQWTRVSQNSKDAHRYSTAAVELAYAIGDPLLAADLSLHVGYDLHGRERSDEAVATLRRAVADLEAAGERARAGLVMSSLATALGYAGQRREALRMHREAMRVHEELGARRMVGVDGLSIAVHFALDGDLTEAEHWFTTCQDAFRDAEDLFAEQICQRNLAHLNLELGRWDASEEAATRALDLDRKLGFTDGHVGLHAACGAVQLVRGQTARAREWFDKAAGTPSDKAAAYAQAVLSAYTAADAALAGRDDEALASFLKAVDLYEQAYSRRNVPLTLCLVACVAARAGDEGAALDALERARIKVEDVGGTDPVAMIGVAEAHIELLRARTAPSPDDAAMLRDLAEARLHAVRDLEEPGVQLTFGIRLLADSLERARA